LSLIKTVMLALTDCLVDLSWFNNDVRGEGVPPFVNMGTLTYMLSMY